MVVHVREGGEIREQCRHMLSVSTASPIVSCFVKDGRKISVGKCALFKPAQDSRPIVGIIRSLTSDKENNLRVGVNWLYRPAEVKLPKGVALEAEPNEVFYSFHRDEIPVSSLLHPCKVAFLSRGAKLPAGVSSFLCRRVYDFTNKCLWWLTDQDFIDERQIEVNKLLHKTRIEMHASVEHQKSPRSQKLPNGSEASSPKKHSPHSVQNSSFNLCFQTKGKKGDRRDQSCAPKLPNVSETPSKQKHSPDSVQNSSSNLFSQTKGKKRDRRDQSSEPVKRERNAHSDDADSGRFRSESLLSLEIGKIAGKGGLADSEAVSSLVRLLQLEKSQGKVDLTRRSMLAGVIAATDKLDYLTQFIQLKGLAVFDEWLQEIHKGNIGPSRNLDVSDKSLEDFLLVLLCALDKLPVNLNALRMCNIGKSVNHLRSHKNSEIQKNARSLVDTWKKRVEAEMSINDAKSGSSQAVPWPSRSRAGSHVISGSRHSSSLKSSTVKPAQRESNGELSESPQTVALDEKSSGSSQCSSDHVKPMAECGNNAVKTFTAGSKSLNKAIGNGSKHRISASACASNVRKETASNIRLSMARSPLVEEVSPIAVDDPVHLGNIIEGNNHKLIVKIPNRVAQGIPNSGACSPVLPERQTILDGCLKGKHDSLQSSEINGLSAAEHQIPAARVLMTLRKANDFSFSPINALIESCLKYSESNVSMSPGDNIGIDLLASVACGEYSESNIVSSAVCTYSPSINAENSSISCDNQKQFQGVDVIRQEGLLAHVDGADECNISSDVLNVNDGVSTQHLGITNEDLLQQEGCLGDNIHNNISEEPVSITRNGDVDICPEVLNGKSVDVNNERHNLHLATSKSVASLLEAEEKVNGVPLNDEPVNIAHTDTAYPPTAVNVVKTNVCVESESNSLMEQNSCTESLQPDSIEHTVAVNTITNFENPVAVGPCDYADEDVNRRLIRKNFPSQKRANEEVDVVDCADVTMDTDFKVEILQNKEALVQQFRSSGVQICSSAAVLPEDLKSSTKEDKMIDVQRERGDNSVAVTVNADSLPTVGGSGADAKLGFDLNEGFNVDEGKYAEPVTMPAGQCYTNLYPTSAPSIPPDDLLKNKKGSGWKGPAATSAFRPAKPRKLIELPRGPIEAPCPDGAACKIARAPLNIDLNVADESSALDLDLNKIYEAPDMLQQSPSNNHTVEVSNTSLNGLPSCMFSNGEASGKRDFDLNNGPAIEEMPAEQTSYRQPVCNNFPLQSASRPRFNECNTGNDQNVYTWNPSGTSYPVSASPSVLSDRKVFPVVGLSGGPHRVMDSPTSSLSFNPDVYRGSLMSSSPAITFPPALFQYPVFPFGTSNPLSTSGYMDLSSSGRISAISSQLVGNGAAVSVQYPHAYVVSHPITDVSNVGVIDMNQKLGNQGVDLNSGLGSIDLKGRDGSMPDVPRQVSAINSRPLVDEQARMYSMGGGILKRKEPDGGWSMDNLNFKQFSHWR